MSAGGPGTITQWMFICSCQAKLLEQASDQSFSETTRAAEERICSNCGKTIGGNRSGTLTQWIFRSDLCQCEQSLLHPDVPDSESLLNSSQENDEEDREEAPVLELSEEILPVERYDALKLLGQGASGAVYKCRDRVLNKLVAVKSLKLKERSLFISFQKEAKALCLLSHPNIIKVIDFGMTRAETPYMVMEHFEGESLESHLDSWGHLPEPSALELILGIVESLEHAHENGIYHRDLKPSNILIRKNQDTIARVMLIDFGVAALVKEEEQKDSQGNTLAGTPLYMSPDQVKEKRYDARSEIYSLGVLLFEMLTGEVPFGGDTSLEILNQHATAKPPALSEVAPDIVFSDQVESIVARCLEKNPDNRFQSMKELKEALLNVDRTEIHQRLSDSENASNTIYSSDSEPGSESGEGKRSRLILSTTLSIVGLGLVITAILSFSGAINLFPNSADISSKSEQNKSHNSRRRNGKDSSRSSSMSKTSEDNELFPREASIVQSNPETEVDFSLEKMEYGLMGLFASRNVTDDKLKELVGRKDFNALDLSRTKVTGETLDLLKDKPIVYLNVSDTALQEKGFSALAKFKELKALRLERVPVNDRVVESISKLKDLTVLDLEATGLTDGQVAKLKTLSNLTNLDISNNFSLTNEALIPLAELKSLKTLYLSNTAIDGKSLERLIQKSSTLSIMWLIGCKNISFDELNRFESIYPGRTFIRPHMIDEIQPVMEDPIGK